MTELSDEVLAWFYCWRRCHSTIACVI